MCVGVTLWFGCGDVVSVCRLKHLFHYLMLNMFQMLIHPPSGACDLFVELFHGLYWSGSMCVGVTLWSVFGVPESYVYWNVHHLDRWIKRAQLDITSFIISLFNAQQVSDVNTSILRSLRLICWVISHIKPGMWNSDTWHDIFRTYYQKAYYTQRTLNKHKTTQQPIFAETRFLKQPHTSRLNTPY